jgi:ABC-type uncharacterized transport system auxiliary subunit
MALGLGACSLAGRTPEMRYYVLALPEPATPQLSAPIRVDGLTVEEPYTGRQIAYRTSPYRLDYYSYHRWAGRPQSVVGSAVRDYLERATRGDDGPPIEITAHIRRLEEVDAPDGWFADLALDVTARRDGEVVLEHAYAEREPAAVRNPEAVVAAMSRALARILEQLVSALAQAAPPSTSP